MNSTNLPKAGMLRRLTAFAIDGVSIIVIEGLLGGLVFALLEGLVSLNLMTYGNYLNAPQFLSTHPTGSLLFMAYLAVIWFGFFSFFWIKKGQTIGMKILKLKIRSATQSELNLTQCVIRLATAAFGLGNLFVLIDTDKRGFQDIWANTKIIVQEN